MRILIVINSLGAGGAERSTEVLCDYLEQKNINFQVLCLDKVMEGVQNSMFKKGYKIDFIPEMNLLKKRKFLVNFIKEGDFCVVHSILFRSNLLTRFAKISFNFTHLESLVNTTYSKERLRDKGVNQMALKFYKSLDRVTALRYVDHFHSITETVKEHYIEEIGLKSSKVSVVPRGRKPIISSISEKPSITFPPLRLINVGRHEFQKGQIHLLRAMKLFKDENKNVELKIYGREGSATLELKQYIQKNDLGDVVKLEGFSNNISDYLLKAHIFVFPSLYEGLGGSLIEAQAAGLAIACNDIPVLHEVVEKDVNCNFFDVYDVESIKNSIDLFLENPSMISTYGKASLDNYNSKFNEDVNHEKLLKVYKELC